MREVFDQDRAMTLGAVKQATALLGLVFLIAGAFIILSGFGHIFDGRIFGGLMGIVIGFAVLCFMYITVRLMGETLAALHRLNDRLAILGDDIRSQREKSAAQNDKA